MTRECDLAARIMVLEARQLKMETQQLNLEALVAQLVAECERYRAPTDNADPLALKVDELRVAAREFALPIHTFGITEKDVAKLLGKSPATIKNWRLYKKPMKTTKIGNCHYYSLEVMAEYLLKGDQTEFD